MTTATTERLTNTLFRTKMVGHKDEVVVTIGFVFTTMIKIFEGLDIKLINEILYAFVLASTFIYTLMKCYDWIKKKIK